MIKDIEILLKKDLGKALKSIYLLKDSVENYVMFDPAYEHTPKELEPYDALSDRFMRAVELSLKVMRTYEKYMFAENSFTLRDLLNRMEKLEWINSTILWLDMRNIRNKIVHEYESESLSDIYNLIIDFSKELFYFEQKILVLKSQIPLF